MFSGIRACAASETGAIPDRRTDRERHPQRASRFKRGRRGIRSSEGFLRRGETHRRMSRSETSRPSREEGLATRRCVQRLVTKSTCTPFFPQGPDEACRTRKVRQVSPKSAVPPSLTHPATRRVNEGRAQRGVLPSGIQGVCVAIVGGDFERGDPHHCRRFRRNRWGDTLRANRRSNAESPAQEERALVRALLPRRRIAPAISEKSPTIQTRTHHFSSSRDAFAKSMKSR